MDSNFTPQRFTPLPERQEPVSPAMEASELPYWLAALLPDDADQLKLLVEGGTSVLYGFPATVPTYLDAEDAMGWTAFNLEQKIFVSGVFRYISTVVNLNFRLTTFFTASDVIAFGNNSQTDSVGYAYYPFDLPIGSDVFFSKDDTGNLAPADGEYAALTYIHEIGHALGLKHPFQDGAVLGLMEDTTAWTVMSYTDDLADFHAVFQVLDIAALHYLYGPSPQLNGGDTTFSISESATNFIADGSGLDTVDASAVSTSVTISLIPGKWGYVGQAAEPLITAAGQITVNFGTVIERLNGSTYADFLEGNDTANRIFGNDGNDTLIGGGGNDSLHGGEGIDTVLFPGDAVDYSIVNLAGLLTVTGSAADGEDTLESIERIRFADSALAFDLDGSAGSTVKLLGAVLGTVDPELVGVGIDIFDNAGLTFEQVMEVALEAVLGPNPADGAVVSLLWDNLVGGPAPTDLLADLEGALESGAYTQAGLAAAAAEHAVNLDNIGLVGLVETGVEYI